MACFPSLHILKPSFSDYRPLVIKLVQGPLFQRLWALSTSEVMHPCSPPRPSRELPYSTMDSIMLLVNFISSKIATNQ